MSEAGIIFFLTALAIVVTVVNIFLKQAGRDEYAYLTVLAGLAIALLKVLPLVMELFTGVQAVFSFY